MSAEFAAALLRPHVAPLNGLVQPQSFDQKSRFAVYRNNVHHSLIEALSATFPVVQALVGEEAFSRLATLFVRKHPPSTPYLTEYGEPFGGFLASRNELRAYPYLAEVAQLEYQLLRSTHAADTVSVNNRLLDLAADPQQLFDSCFTFAPATALLPLKFASATLWERHQCDAPNLYGVEVNCAQWVLISRPEYQLYVDHLEPDEFAFLEALKQGATVGQACELLTHEAQLADYFQRLLERRLITDLGVIRC